MIQALLFIHKKKINIHVAEQLKRYNKLHIKREELSLTKTGELKGWQRENIVMHTLLFKY